MGAEGHARRNRIPRSGAAAFTFECADGAGRTPTSLPEAHTDRPCTFGAVAERVHARLDDAQLLKQESHLEHGGMLLPIIDQPPSPMSDVHVLIETAHGRAEVQARVVHVGEGEVGLALLDAPTARTRLDPLFARARGETPRPQNLRLRITRMSALEKQELALTGERAERMALLKDSNKSVHTLLLKNRKITSDEIRLLAGFRNANPDALAKIAMNREWIRDSRIVTALVSNPKTPPQVAIRLLDRLTTTELRRLARASDVPPTVSRAARRKLG